MNGSNDPSLSSRARKHKLQQHTSIYPYLRTLYPCCGVSWRKTCSTRLTSLSLYRLPRLCFVVICLLCPVSFCLFPLVFFLSYFWYQVKKPRAAGARMRARERERERQRERERERERYSRWLKALEFHFD